jgi:hypothetical protein
MRRCRHHWTEVARRFVPRPTHIADLKAGEELAKRLMFGFTVVELRCEACGELDHRELPGDATPRPSR